MAYLEGLALDEINDPQEYKDRRKKLGGDSHQDRQKRFYQTTESKFKGGKTGGTDPPAAASEQSTDHGDTVSVGTVPPPAVSDILAGCQHCEAKVACSAMDALRAAGATEQPARRLRLSTAGGPPLDTTISHGTAAQSPAQTGQKVATIPGAAKAETAHGSAGAAQAETAHSSAEPPAQPAVPPPAPPPAPRPAKTPPLADVLAQCPLCEHWTSHRASDCPLATAAWPSKAGECLEVAQPRWLCKVTVHGISAQGLAVRMLSYN